MERTDREGPKVVCDAGPLIHLDELDCLNLLGDFGAIIVPAAVRAEVERVRPSVFQNSAVSFKKIDVSEAKNPEVDVVSMLYMLHPGEKEALIICQERNGLFLTDDSAARLSAHQMGIVVHGTIGILIRSIRRNMKSAQEVVEILKSLPEKSSLFISPSLLGKIIKQVTDEGRKHT